jgi:RNA 3'-terminal phosphate cyclase (ATP)
MLMMLTIDGSKGEGGGQVLRTALGLSLVTGTPFRIFNIRGNRGKPGLLRQHLTAVRAARDIGNAELSGDELGSKEITFSPKTLKGGNYAFSIGSAGSTSLVLQTILPALLSAKHPSVVTIEGGTHNDLAPCFHYLKHVFVPQLQKMGAAMDIQLSSYGFMPAGGGRIEARVGPSKLNELSILERGELKMKSATAVVSGIPLKVATRELAVIAESIGLDSVNLIGESVESVGPGNAAWIDFEFENVNELFVGYGSKGVTAEQVARRVSGWANKYLKSNVPVGEYLADQLIIPMALGKGGQLRTVKPSLHTLTQLELVPRFLPVKTKVTEEPNGASVIEVNV